MRKFQFRTVVVSFQAGFLNYRMEKLFFPALRIYYIVSHFNTKMNCKRQIPDTLFRILKKLKETSLKSKIK